MYRNLLNFTDVLIAMAFINTTTDATNLNQQVFATQLGSDVSGNVRNSVDGGEYRSPPALQPVLAETSLHVTTLGARPPRPPVSTLTNLPPIINTSTNFSSTNPSTWH